MSGGSFDYLYLANFNQHREVLEAMAKELFRRGMDEAAEATLAMLREPSQELANLWMKVELHVSGDGGPRAVQEAFQQFLATETPREETT